MKACRQSASAQSTSEITGRINLCVSCLFAGVDRYMLICIAVIVDIGPLIKKLADHTDNYRLVSKDGRQ